MSRTITRTGSFNWIFRALRSLKASRSCPGRNPRPLERAGGLSDMPSLRLVSGVGVSGRGRKDEGLSQTHAAVLAPVLLNPPNLHRCRGQALKASSFADLRLRGRRRITAKQERVRGRKRWEIQIFDIPFLSLSKLSQMLFWGMQRKGRFSGRKKEWMDERMNE